MRKFRIWYVDDDDGSKASDTRGDGTLANPFRTVDGAMIRILGDYVDPRGQILDVHSRLLACVPPNDKFP